MTCWELLNRGRRSSPAVVARRMLGSRNVCKNGHAGQAAGRMCVCMHAGVHGRVQAGTGCRRRRICSAGAPG